MGGFLQALGDSLQSGAQAALSATPQGLSIVQGLRQAAQQQAQLAEHKRQFDMEQTLRQRQFDQSHAQNTFSNQLSLLNAGAQPVTPGADGSLTRQLGGIAGQPGQAQPGGPMMMGGGTPTDIPMRPGNVGPMAQMPAAPQVQGQAPAMPAMLSGTPVIAPAPVQVNSGRVLTPPGGSGGFYIPTMDESAKAAATRKAMEERATGNMVPTPQSLQSLWAEGQAPTEIGTHALPALANQYRNENDRQDTADAKKNPPAKPPKTTVTLTDRDAKLLGMDAGTEVPIDEYKARATMMADDARARKDEASAKRLEAIAGGKGAAAEKPMSKAQSLKIESDKAQGIAKAVRSYQKAMSDLKNTGLEKDPDSVNEVHEQYREDLSRVEGDYGNAINAAGGSYTPNTWFENHVEQIKKQRTPKAPAAAAPAPTPAAAQPQAQAPAQAAQPAKQYKVGDTVNYQGKPHKITGLDAKGKYILTPVQ